MITLTTIIALCRAGKLSDCRFKSTSHDVQNIIIKDGFPYYEYGNLEPLSYYSDDRIRELTSRGAYILVPEPPDGTIFKGRAEL